MSEYVFSNNNEDFSFDDDYDCIEYALDTVTNINDVIEIYRGTPVRYKASDLNSGIDDYLVDQAYDKAGEFSESWCNAVHWGEFRKKLDQFLDETLPAPNFFTVENVETLKAKITKMDDYGFEFEYIDQLEANASEYANSKRS